MTERMSLAEFRASGEEMRYKTSKPTLGRAEKDLKQRKYRNEPTFVDGMRFESRREARRYGALKALEKLGRIQDLECQVRFEFPLEYDSGRKVAYVADFTYSLDGLYVVEDVKSEITRKNPVYRLKKAMMKYFHQIDIVET